MSKVAAIDNCGECPYFYNNWCSLIDAWVHKREIDPKCTLPDSDEFCESNFNIDHEPT